MQPMGIPPSAVSTCSLYPTQEVVWPLALRLVPTSQALGRSRVRSLLVDDLPDREIGHALGCRVRRPIGEHTHEEEDKCPCQARAPTPSPHRRCGVE